MVFADRVAEERATFVKRPCTDDIAGQEVARATRIFFGQVFGREASFCEFGIDISNVYSYLLPFQTA